MKRLLLIILVAGNCYSMDCYTARIFEDCNYDDLCIEQSIKKDCILAMREDEPELTDDEIIRLCKDQE